MDTDPAKTGPAGPMWRYIKIVLLFIINNWLIFGIGVACVTAYYFPSVAKTGGSIRSEWSILYGAVSIIFLISGLSIPTRKLSQHAGNYRLHITVQGLSFIVVPAVVFIVVKIVYAAHGKIEETILIGMIAISCIPTTIASNVLMTRRSGGDDAAALVEVVIGNVLGPFITPILVTKVFWPDDVNPALKPASTAQELGNLYGHVFKQLGLTVLLPLAVGQTVQYIWSEKVKWTVEKFYLGKVATFCLSLLIWTTFSNSFATGALQSLQTTSLLFNIFVNIGLYVFFTILCYVLARPPSIPYLHPKSPKLRWKQFSKMSMEETIAICFCGAAKTTGLGIPLVTILWRNYGEDTISIISIPVVLYTTEQIFIAQALVWYFRWQGKRRLKEAEKSTDEEDAIAPTENNEKE